MSIRKVPLVEGEYYHIYNRGNNKQKIYFEDLDYERFMKLLFLCNSEKKFNFKEDIVQNNINAWDFEKGDNLVNIGAYVLMPNHFHIYLSSKLPKSDIGNIDKSNKNNITEFMRKLCTAYVKYINKKYNRSGGLFEGKFKSVHIKNDNQAKYLFSYIHLNPIKLIQKNWKEEGINNIKESLKFLDEYKWSSYLDYLGKNREENKIINRIDFLNYFNTEELFQDEVFEWLNLPKSDFGGFGGF